MAKKFRKLCMERMEAREMMAGDVSAVMQGNDLILSEAVGQAGLDNAVSIARVSDTMVRVMGMPTLSDGTVSTINGAASQVLTINANTRLVVNLGAGNDAFTFAPVGGELSFKEININMAAPEPVVTRTTTETRQVLSNPFVSDDDVVFLERFKTSGPVTVKTGAGKDLVNILNGQVGVQSGTPANVYINTGAGADLVRVRTTVGNPQITGNLDIVTYKTASENDVDSVSLETLGVQGNVSVRTGGGADVLNFDHVGVNHRFVFDAGAGSDTATMKDVSALDAIMAQMGEGDDTLTTSGLYTLDLTLDGGSGFDRLTRGADPYFAGATHETGWEWANGYFVLQPLYRRLEL